VGYDVVIRNGTVVDGTGMDAYRADVGVQDGRIAAIGRISDKGREEVDAEGQVVTPGFIEGHTHMDAQVFWDALGSCSCWHGVTTVVMGNCGFTLAPAHPDARELVVRNLERAEDISGKAMAQGIDWTWTTFAEYLDAVDRLPKGINYVSKIGHSALRTFVMGERAWDGESTPEDIEAMGRELENALRAGAYGFTTSRTTSHETSDNRPVVSRLAAWDEVRYLVGLMGELGGTGVFQLVQDLGEDEERIRREQLLLQLAVESGVPIAKSVGSHVPGFGLDLLDETAAAGGRMFGLTHCRGVGIMMSFRSQLPFDRLPVWSELRALPFEEQKHLLRDPEMRKRLVWSAHNSEYPKAIGTEAKKPDFDRMQVLERPIPPNPTVAQAAAARGVDPVELMIDLALATDFQQFFVQTNQPFDHEATKTVMKHPRTVMAFSDSGAHVSQISDCSVQTHLLAHWVRDRQDFTLEEAVRMMTLLPARAWSLSDRGLLRTGLVADINVFDPETVRPEMPTLVHDLPGGEPRIEQKATGFRATLVGGTITQRDGEHTGALPGKLVRGPLATASA